MKQINTTLQATLLALIASSLLSSCAAWPMLTGAAGLAAGKKNSSSPFFFLPGSSSSLDRVEITAPATSFAKTTTLNLKATAIYSNSTNADITGTAGWSSSDSSIIQVQSNGQATGTGAGSATVSISYEGKTAQAILTVTSAPLSGLTITCINQGSSLPVGVTRACTLTGNFADGTSQNLTTDPNTVWSTGNSTIASFDGSNPDGIVTAKQAGTTSLKASYNGTNAPSLSLTVSTASLASIQISPLNASLPLGKTQQYQATGTYTDSSTQDITTQVTWTSSDTAKAQFSGTPGQEGLLSADAEGASTVTASLSGVNASTQVTVTAAVLESITITPSNPSAPAGTQVHFTATGTFSDGSGCTLTDGSVCNVTTQVTWSSNNTSVVTIANGVNYEGVATAGTVGSATITAEIGGISGSTTFVTTAAALTSIQVTFADSSIARGTSTTAQATGLYTDGSNQNISDQVSWSSSNVACVQIGSLTGVPSVTLISPKTGATGAACSSIQATKGAVSGSAALTVTAARLVSVQVDPTNPSVALGLPQAFTATGTYTDDTTQDLTNAVTWSSSSTGVATISNGVGTKGIASTVAQGTTDITATCSSAGCNPGGPTITSPASTLTVGAHQLQSITIAPSPALSIAKGRTQDFTATGHYTDGSTTDLTTLVAWASSDTDNATISNANGSRGRMTAIDQGSAGITATYSSITSASTSVTVTAAVLESIQVTPAGTSLPKGLQSAFTATGVYSDASTLNITTQVTWASTATGVATVSNASGSEGLVTGLALGNTTISATLSSVTGQTGLTVSPAVLVSIAVSPTTPTIYTTQTKDFLATGTYSDSSQLDITTQVTWASSSTSVATVSNAGGTEGRATGVSAGSASISATQISSGISGSTTLTVTAADTIQPTVLSVASLSPTTVRVIYSEPVNSTEATVSSAYRVSLGASVTGSCSDNSNFSSPADISVSSVTGSGAIYTLTLSSSQTSGTSYTVIVDRTAIHDVGLPTPNALGCANYSDFVGQEQLKVSQAICSSTTSAIVTFSKSVKTGNNLAGSAECTSNVECAYRYTLTGGSDLGSISTAKVLDGIVCGGAAADSSKVCITHTLTQSGAQYSVVVANGVSGDGFDNAWGSLRDSGDSENVQTSPRDRATFLGCGSTPVNFVDGPISVNPFSDGSSFGYLTDYNGKIYIGPNNLGNAAERFAYDGSGPESVSFTFAKDTVSSGGSDTSRNPATSRDSGIAVPPFVTLGHSGCTSTGASAAANLSTGCGPDGEDGRGVFATGILGSTPYIFVGGARSTTKYGASPDFNYIYYTSDTAAGLNFKYIDLASITGSKTSGTEAMVITGDRYWGGYAKINAGANSPDFGFVSFNSSDTAIGFCTAGSSCDADDGVKGRRTYINYLPYFGGSSTSGGNTSPNWGYIVGVDSMYVFRGYIYAANGGLNKIGHNGSIIRANTTSPTAQCSSPLCAQWVEIGPRSQSAWHGASSNWFSIELTKTYDLIPHDKAFSMFAEFNGNLYVTRTLCQTSASALSTYASSVSNIAGCTDGTDSNRRAQLWKCIPEATGGSDVCDAADWSIVGDDGTGVTNFGDSGNHSITMVVKNGSYLYIAFDNAAGMQVWRTQTSNPGSSSSSWEKIGGNGFGDTANIQQFFSAVSVSVNGVNYLYVSAGKNGIPVRVYRQQNN